MVVTLVTLYDAASPKGGTTFVGGAEDCQENDAYRETDIRRERHAPGRKPATVARQVTRWLRGLRGLQEHCPGCLAPQKVGGPYQAARPGSRPPHAPGAGDGPALARLGQEVGFQQPAQRPSRRPQGTRPERRIHLPRERGQVACAVSGRRPVGRRGCLRGGIGDRPSHQGARSLQGGPRPVRGRALAR